MILLGIEAGGTRTVALATGGNLDAPIRREFGPANLWLLDDPQLTRRLRAIAREIPKPAAIGIGMAGARTPADRARLAAAAARVWPGIPCHATSDLEIALMAAAEPTPHERRSDAGPSKAPPAARVLIVSGTGSCCLGRGVDGRTERLGGWGHVIGDRGSGYDIAVAALKAVIRAMDHERRWPALGARFLRALLLNAPEDLVVWAPAASKADVAALAVEVFDAAADGDRLATHVLHEAARTLAADGAACADLVAAARVPVQFVLAGSVLVKQPRFAARVSKLLREARSGAIVTVLDRESVWGAIALARASLGTPADAPPPTAPSVARKHDEPLAALRRSPTELRNPRSMDLDDLPIEDAVRLMLEEDARITPALLASQDAIARGVRLIAHALSHGGRLFYAGAGTSGRLGVLDASECPPTFRTPKDLVQGIIAGGSQALWSSVEGAEDDEEAGRTAVTSRRVSAGDVLVGIAASGRTPFVWGALREAMHRGASTILLCFNPHVEIALVDRPTLVIAPDVGPEVLTGSTRLKAGTATKMVLNIFTTLAMVRLGKVKSNLMIDVNASNAKLRDRAVRIVVELTGSDHDTARATLARSNWQVRKACAKLGSP
jgi:N-acetylmuramic acid 6-phosphate etherase